jgi:hypothetical protein
VIKNLDESAGDLSLDRTVGEIGTLVQGSEYTLTNPSQLLIQASERGKRSLYPKQVDEPDSRVATGNVPLLLPSRLKQYPHASDVLQLVRPQVTQHSLVPLWKLFAHLTEY